VNRPWKKMLLFRAAIRSTQHSSKNVRFFTDLPPYANGGLADVLKSTGTPCDRGWAAYDPLSGGVAVSHPSLEPLANMLRMDKRDYLQHEGLYFELGRRSGALLGAFIWNTTRGQGCGGIRLRSYPSTAEYVTDGMRLAIGMGRKSALAGLWAGGAKGVIAAPTSAQSKEERHNMMIDYGDFLSSLRGCYVAAEDAGLHVEDCNAVFSHTRFMTCISDKFGGSGNPSVPTAAGVCAAMEAAVDFRKPGDTLVGKTVAVQGAGNVGLPLMHNLFESGVKKIIASDVDADRLAFLKKDLAVPTGSSLDLRLCSVGDNSILKEPCDIVSPCGYGEVLSDETIAALQCDIICGAANNQLADPVNGDSGIQARDILYVPDFVANRMGIVNCADESFGRVGSLGDHTQDPAVARHLDKNSDWENSVYNITKAVCQRAQDDGITPGQAANSLADEMASKLHPIWPNRSRDIQYALRAGDDWINAA